jgi:LuxR family maltose regulon positive regulatory protein
MGELHYEWNELAAAGDRLSQGLARAELGGDARSLIAGHLIAMRLHLSQGDLPAAAGDLERARPLKERSPFPEWCSRFERCQVDLWLAQGRVDDAVAWAEAMLLESGFEVRPEYEAAQLAAVRVLIGSDEAARHERASRLLERLLQSATAEGRLGVQIEALTLRAVARWNSGDRTGAMIGFELALRLAEPEGYRRLFLDLGRPVDRLLQEARSRGVMPEYVADLVAARGDDLGAPGDPAQLPEPLSAREQEILLLIAAGLTNREIGERLSISAQTVKKHTANIYGKLGVSHRTAAVAMARDLELLA